MFWLKTKIFPWRLGMNISKQGNPQYYWLVWNFTSQSQSSREQIIALENAARAKSRQKEIKGNIRTTQGAFENYASTSQNPHCIRGTLYFSSLFLKDLVNIFLYERFKKILMTFRNKEAMVSGLGFHF